MTINLSELPRGGTVCLSKAGLGSSTTTLNVAIAAPNGAGVDFAINGIAYHLADDAAITITAADVQAALTKCIYLICLDSTGALTTVKGTEVLTADLTAGTKVLQWPVATVDTCPIGAVKIQTSTATTFTAGTTGLTAAGITATYYDFFAVPPAPLTS